MPNLYLKLFISSTSKYTINLALTFHLYDIVNHLVFVVIMLSLNSCHFKAVFHQFSPFVCTNYSLSVHQGECRQASIYGINTVLFNSLQHCTSEKSSSH